MHQTTFLEKKIALFGNTQPVFDKPVASSAANVILATNLQFKVNNSSTVEELNTDALHGDAIVSMTDQYASVDFDSYVPKLGSRYARRYPANEVTVMMVDASLPTGSSFTISAVTSGSKVLTATVTDPNGVSPIDFVTEFLLYVNSGVTPQPHTSFVGELDSLYKATQVVGLSSGLAGILFSAAQEQSNQPDISVTSLASPSSMPYVTVTKFDGNTYLGSTLPIAPYLESSSLYQTIFMGQGLCDFFEGKLEDANRIICELLTELKRAWAYLGQAVVWIDEMRKMVSSDATLVGQLDAAKANAQNLQRYVENWVNALNMCKGDLKLLQADYYLNFKTQDLNKMLADFADDLKWATGLTRGSILQTSGATITPTTASAWFVELSGSFAVGDKITVDGVTVENTGSVVRTATEVGNVLASGTSGTGLTLTGVETPWTSVTNLASSPWIVNYTAASAIAPPVVTIVPAAGSTFNGTITASTVGLTSTSWKMTIAAPISTIVEASSWLEFCGVKATVNVGATNVALNRLYDAIYYYLQSPSSPTAVAGVTVTVTNPSVANTWTVGAPVGSGNIVAFGLNSSVAVASVPFDEGVQWVGGGAAPYAVSKTAIVGDASLSSWNSYAVFHIPSRTYPTGTTFRLTINGAVVATFTATAPASANDLVNAYNRELGGDPNTPTGNISFTGTLPAGYRAPITYATVPAYYTNTGSDVVAATATLHLENVSATSTSQMTFTISPAGENAITITGALPSFALSSVLPTEYFILSDNAILAPNGTFSFNGESFVASATGGIRNIPNILETYYTQGGSGLPSGITKTGGSQTITMFAVGAGVFRSPSGVLPRFSMGDGRLVAVIPYRIADDNALAGMLGQSIVGATSIAAGTVFDFCGNTLTTVGALSTYGFYFYLSQLVQSRSLNTAVFTCPSFVAPPATLAAACSYFGLLIQSNTGSAAGTSGFTYRGGDSAYASTFSDIVFAGSTSVSRIIPAIAAEDKNLQRTANQDTWKMLIGGWLNAGESVTIAGRTITNSGSGVMTGAAVVTAYLALGASGVTGSGNELIIADTNGFLNPPWAVSTSSSTLTVGAIPAGTLPHNFLPVSQPRWDYVWASGNADVEAGATVTIPAFGLAFQATQAIPAIWVASVVVALANGGTSPFATRTVAPIADTTWTAMAGNSFGFTVAYAGTTPITGATGMVVTDGMGDWIRYIPPQASYFVPSWWEAPWYLDFAGTFEAGDIVEALGLMLTVDTRLSSEEVAQAFFALAANVSTGVAGKWHSAMSPRTAIDSDLTAVQLHNNRIVLQRAAVPPATGVPRTITEGFVFVTKTLTNKSDIKVLMGSNLDDQDLTEPFLTLALSGVGASNTTDPLLQQTFLEYKTKATGYLVEAKKLLDLAIIQDMGGTSNPPHYNLTQILKEMIARAVTRGSAGANPTWSGTITYDGGASATSTGWSTGMFVSDLCPCLDHLCFSNTVESPDMMTLQVRRSSTQLVGEQKTAIVKDARALVDLNLEMGKRPMLTFRYEGNLHDTLQMDELQVALTRQKYDVASVIAAKTIRNASLTDTCGQGSGIGCDCYGEYWNNICLVKGSFPNFAGMGKARALTSCGNVWSYARQPWDFTLEIIQEKADTSNPLSFNVEDSLGKTFNFAYLQEGTAGETIEVNVRDAVLKDYADGSSQGLVTHVLTFTCTGASQMCLK